MARGVLTTEPTLITESGTAVRRNQIVFITEQYGLPEIAVMNADGSGRTRLTEDQIGYAAPAVSPDGKRILYATRLQTGFSIFVMKTDGTYRRRLTFGSFDGSPAWSRDGRWIAFRGDVSTPFGSAGRIFVMTAEGTGVHQVSPEPKPGAYVSHDGPTWSPDGQRLAYTSNGALTVMGADGSNPTPIGVPNYICNYPDWSPNGARIACAGFGTSGYAVYSMRPDGTGFLVHVSGPEQLGDPSWSPAGANLAFDRVVSGVFQLFRVALPPGGVEQPLSGNVFHDLQPQWVSTITMP